MSQIEPEQVRRLLVGAEEAQAAADAARQAQDALDHTLLDVARRAKVGVSELAAVTGLHPNSVRAGIRRAAGESNVEYDQLSFDFEALADHRAASFPNAPADRGPASAPAATSKAPTGGLRAERER